MTEAEVADRYGEVVARYNSTRNAANVYEVRRKDGALSCNCPGWRFSGIPKSCRHTRRVAEGLDDDQAVAERTDRAVRLSEVLVYAFNNTAYRNNNTRSAIAALVSGTRQAASTAHYTQMAQAVLRLLDALDASGLFAPREAKPYVAPSRGLRVITLDDD